jgi:hypothetical protein
MTAEEYIEKFKFPGQAGYDLISFVNAKTAMELVKKEEQGKLQKYINELADTLSNEIMWANGITSGNYSHIVPAMKGAAIRRIERMIKLGLLDSDIYGHQLND